MEKVYVLKSDLLDISEYGVFGVFTDKDKCLDLAQKIYDNLDDDVLSELETLIELETSDYKGTKFTGLVYIIAKPDQVNSADPNGADGGYEICVDAKTNKVIRD